MSDWTELDEKFMRAARAEAKVAASVGEIPVGAVVVKEGRRERVRTVIEASREWGTLRERLIEGEYDDLYLWIEELVDGG